MRIEYVGHPDYTLVYLKTDSGVNVKAICATTEDEIEKATKELSVFINKDK